MTPELLRAYVLILMRDVLIPGAGVFLAIWLPITGVFEPWQIPFVLSLVGVPLVGRIGQGKHDGEREPVEPESR
jgi:hypothetical protein